MTPLFMAISCTSTLPATGAADQLIRRSTLVFDGEIAATNLGAARRGPRPGMVEYKIADFYLLSSCGTYRNNREGNKYKCVGSKSA